MADLKKEILAISRRPENALCVDCRMPQPTWASFNLGVFMCMTCAGHHRSLGTHITRVRSVTMDNWDAPSVALMGSVGNVRANTFFEAKLQPQHKIHPGVDDNARREFITAKYVNRSFYAAPAGGAAAAASATAVAEAKPLSKMEQRQLRLQAKQASASSTPQPTTSASPAPIPQPSAPIRQSSTPNPTTTSSSNPDANLFAGMNVTKPAAATAVAAPVPIPAAAPKVHSSSPWVTREQHQQIQQQQHQNHNHLQQPHHHMSHSSSFPNNSSSNNILDFSAPAPVAAAAASNGVDDMFAGLSVSNTSASASPSIAAPAATTNGAPAAGAKINSSELLSFYAYEPASAPARSQHPASGSVGASPAIDMFGSLNTNQQAMQQQSIIADPSASTSSFSFLSEPAAVEPAPAAAASAFSFLGGDDHHVPATTTTSASPLDNFSDLLPPADSASAPPLLPTPDLAAFATQQPAAALQPLPFLNNVTMPAMVGVGGQPVGGFMPMGNGMDNSMNPMGMQGMVAPYGMPNAGVGAPMMNPTMGLLFPTNMPLIPALAQRPLHGHSLLPSSSSPMFMVQSVQASQQAAQQQATALANDPFAHIHVTAASPAPVPTVSPTQQNLAPKQPHQCDVDGCDGKKVSRGLCAKHIRGVDGAAPSSQQQQQQQQPAAGDATFGFLSATNSAALQQPAPVEASGFGFI